jgi:hypothetical protein
MVIRIVPTRVVARLHCLQSFEIWQAPQVVWPLLFWEVVALDRHVKFGDRDMEGARAGSDTDGLASVDALMGASRMLG